MGSAHWSLGTLGLVVSHLLNELIDLIFHKGNASERR